MIESIMKRKQKKVLLIHLSSDAVYPYNRGNNKEISSSPLIISMAKQS